MSNSHDKEQPAKPLASSQTNKKAKNKMQETVVFNIDVFQAIQKARKELGMTYTQDVIRLAVASFLKKEGYL